MEEAIRKIYFHIIGKNKITLYGDYDVDGASACAILSKYLKHQKDFQQKKTQM